LDECMDGWVVGGWLDEWMGGWMDGLVGGGTIYNTLIISVKVKRYL